MMALSLFKAWIAFRAYERRAGINLNDPSVQENVAYPQYNRDQKNPAYYSQRRRSEHCTIRIGVEVS